MPVYEYECRKCSCHFDVIRSFSELNDPGPVCVHCGSRNTIRKLGNIIVLTKDGRSGTALGGSSCSSCSSRSSSSCSGCGKG